CKGDGARSPAAQHDRNHAAESTHLLFGELVLRVGGQPRVIEHLDVVVPVEVRGNRTRVVFVFAHAHRERLDAAQGQETVERAGNAADRILVELHDVEDRLVTGRDKSAHRVRMAADVFRGGVHDDVDPEVERVLQVRGRKRVVHRRGDAVLAAERCYST